MVEKLGYSVYLSSLEAQMETLPRGNGELVFLSLHISEEFGPDYRARAEEACRLLNEAGWRVLADVSVKTMEQFGEADLGRLAGKLGLWGLRVDYGLTEAQVADLARRLPVVVNASTIEVDAARRMAGAGGKMLAMHNFYPRPETGLDEGYLLERTRELQAAGLEVLAFIPGDLDLRGPVREGLPTLEAHRRALPSAGLVDLALRFGLDGVFVGDPGLSGKERERIQRFLREGVISLPVELAPEYAGLWGKEFTNRVDSPAWLVRFMESREYSCLGARVEPGEVLPRERGCLTVDNARYGRYSGEIQLVRQDLPADARVNVIGRVPREALLLMDNIGRGGRFVLEQA